MDLTFVSPPPVRDMSWNGSEHNMHSDHQAIVFVPKNEKVRLVCENNCRANIYRCVIGPGTVWGIPTERAFHIQECIMTRRRYTFPNRRTNCWWSRELFDLWSACYRVRWAAQKAIGWIDQEIKKPQADEENGLLERTLRRGEYKHMWRCLQICNRETQKSFNSTNCMPRSEGLLTNALFLFPLQQSSEEHKR